MARRKGAVFKNRKIRDIAFIYLSEAVRLKVKQVLLKILLFCGNSSSLDIKERFGDVQVYHFTKGVRTYGSQD